MSAAWEPERIRTAVKNLLPTPGDGSSQYVVIPRSDHVSILFDATAMSDAQNWAARVLHLESHPTLPSHRGVLGFLAGFAGILLLAGPFLREILQTKNQAPPLVEIVTTSVKPRVFLEYPIVALGTVALLSYSDPPPRSAFIQRRLLRKLSARFRNRPSRPALEFAAKSIRHKRDRPHRHPACPIASLHHSSRAIRGVASAFLDHFLA